MPMLKEEGEISPLAALGRDDKEGISLGRDDRVKGEIPRFAALSRDDKVEGSG